MGSATSDADRVQAARAGDQEAFAVLVERHRSLLVALCGRMLGDPMLAEDAAQEACLQAWLTLDLLRQPASFGPWLSGIGLNICRRWLRQRTRDPWPAAALQGGCAFPAALDSGPDLEAQVEEAELASRVQLAVGALPAGQRAAVLLFYLGGLTYAEAAAHLDIPVTAVKTRLHKARATLRRDLTETWKEYTMVSETRSDSEAAVPMRVADIRRVPAEGDAPARHVIILEEIDGGRRMAIWVGRFEGEGIALQLEKVQTARPLTYSFMGMLLREAGGRLRQVRITRIADEVFFAAAIVDGPSGTRTVDARPSDALALALVTGTPIVVEADVLGSHALPLEPEGLFGAGSQGAQAIAAERLAAAHG